mmetsp:Transcript_60453/g.69474  ORF Transcript_60453/g.69474 Transcript_60453/m.69474 type:complete len:92 (+) Transcript_60453:527-802(+)
MIILIKITTISTVNLLYLDYTVAMTNDNYKNDNSMPATTTRVYTYTHNDTVFTTVHHTTTTTTTIGYGIFCIAIKNICSYRSNERKIRMQV